MAKAIIRAAKQKGGSVAASGKHNDRTRETPNADKEKEKDNQVLIGDERNVREIVTEIIDEHGGRPRSDSVEAVELVMTASREFFTDGQEEIIPQKVDAFVERGLVFLNDKSNLGICAKAVLHVDERTPHIQAHMVPIDPNGKLNCKYFLGGRAKMVALQDKYYEVMKPLGLERGERGSRATHTAIQKFYGAITKNHSLGLDLNRLPDPPRLSFTKESVEAYKRSFVEEVNRQVAEPLKTLNHQAGLAREERGRREASERASAEKVAEAERGRAEAERAALAAQTKLQEMVTQNRGLWDLNDTLEKKSKGLEKELTAERLKTREQSARVADISMEKVMDRLVYFRRDESSYTYRDTAGRVAFAIQNDNTLRDSKGEVICSNSIDLVIQMEKIQGRTLSEGDAANLLSKTFGEKEVKAAFLAKSEQLVSAFFEKNRVQEREQQKAIEPERQPATRAQEPAQAKERDRGVDREEHIHSR